MNWHYLDNGQQRGPVTEEQFSTLVQQGVIREDTFIWCQGMEKWQRYGELVPTTADVAASAGGETAATAEEVGGSLRMHHEEAPPAETREGACSQCGAVVPVTHLMTIGSRQLCPQCQVGQRRLAATGWSGGALEYANPFLRLAAFILDGLLYSLGVIVLIAVFNGVVRLFPDNKSAVAGTGLIFLLLIVWWLFHYWVGRIAREGATPAMKWMKIRVVSASGDPISWWRALARFLMIGLVNTFTLYLGHIVALFDQQKRSLHDMVCGTIVIKS